jgi:hypothetical protein
MAQGLVGAAKIRQQGRSIMFKVGDKVRVRSYDEIEKTLDVNDRLIDDGIHFTYDMKGHCGHLFEVTHVFDSTETKTHRVKLRNNERSWHPIWLVPQIIDNRSIN